MGSKIKYEDVKLDIESAGWQLVSGTYTNLKTDLELLCPNSHQVFRTYNDWRTENIHECPICSHMTFKKINEKPTKKKGYRVLAFDQASITSGWSVFDDSSLVNYGKWTSNGTKSTQRISQTKAWFASMISTWKPDLIVLEDIQLQKFSATGGGESVAVTTYKKLAHLQGVLKNYCYENGIPYLVVPPATWRNLSGIKGKERTDRKRSAQLKVKSLYDIDVSQDEADAILIGRYAAAQQNSVQMVEFG